MKYRYLGKSGLKLSALSYGTWATFAKNVNEEQAIKLIAFAYNSGINFFDCAENYENGMAESMLGNIFLKQDWPRNSYCLSSKVFFGGEKPTQLGLHRKHIFDACHASLVRLKTDYIDFYFCHRPDPNTPISETVWAMHNLITQGKILYWGTSEWPAKSICDAYDFSKKNHLIGPTMEQAQYNIFIRDKVEKQFLGLYDEFGLGLTTWSPLYFGVLAGRYLKGFADTRAKYSDHRWLIEDLQSDLGQKKLSMVKKLQPIAKAFDCSLPQLAIAWCLSNENVSTVLLGASKVDQLKENILVSLYNSEKLDEIREQVNKLVSTELID